MGVNEGLVISEVHPGGPSAAAGLRSGDIITEIEGQPARSLDQLVALTITRRAGDQVRLTYHRAGQSHRVNVTLGSRTSTQSAE
jgi:putative serine protease PepD